MTCDSDLQTTFFPLHDSAFHPSKPKRSLPASFHDQFQEIPHKARKTEPKSTATISTQAQSQDTPVKSKANSEQEFQLQLPLKVKYESSIRRFSVPASTSFKDLRLKLAKKMLEDKVLSIEYKDDQGDRVVLSSDSDMAEFSRVVSSRGMDPVQLRVNLSSR